MRNVKNLKVVAASLCLGATLLTGCNCDARIVVGKSNIEYYYDDNEITGNITFGDLNEYGKIIVLEDNREKFTRLLIKSEEIFNEGTIDPSIIYNHIKYKDLETGATIIDYRDYIQVEKEEWEKSEHLEIVSEIGISSYLINNNFVKTEYTVEELMAFYYEILLPSLDIEEKELVKCERK